jgi:hypothetical protein
MTTTKFGRSGFSVPMPKPGDGTRIYLNHDGTITCSWDNRMAMDAMPRRRPLRLAYDNDGADETPFARLSAILQATLIDDKLSLEPAMDLLRQVASGTDTDAEEVDALVGLAQDTRPIEQRYPGRCVIATA